MIKKYGKELLVVTVAALTLFGCGSASKNDKEAVVENAESSVTEESSDDASEITGVANPWEDSDCDDIFQTFGFAMNLPVGATDVSYQKNMDDGIAQMLFKLGDARMQFTFRMAATNEFEDISGLYYEWDVEDESEYKGCEAKFCRANTEEQTVDSMLWYEAAPGVMYSLSTAAEDLDGFDIQAIADELFIPMQGEVEEFMPSNFLEVSLMSDDFDSYDDVISKLSPENAYAFVNVMGADEQVLMITESTYDNLDGNMATIDASVYMEKDGKARCVGNVISYGTAYPISLSDDGKVYSGGNHEVDISCICPETNGIMSLVYAYETFDEEGNATYGGFIRDKASLEDDGVSIAEDDASVLPKLYEDYSTAKPINFTVIE